MRNMKWDRSTRQNEKEKERQEKERDKKQTRGE